MAGRSRQVLETVLSVVDNTTGPFKRVEKNAKRLEDLDPEITVSADDDASDELADIRDKLDRLDGDEAEALVKAEARKARRDVRQFTKDLLEVDDAEVEAEIRIDKAQAQRRLDALEAEMSDAGDDAGVAYGGSLIKGFGVAGVGAALVKLIDTGFDRAGLRARFAQRFGLVAQDAERLGKEAGDLYADGWGDSRAEVLDVLGQVQQQLVTTGEISQGVADDLAEGALAIAEVWGADASEVIRSAGQLLKNDLAPNGEAALDLIVEGFQNGANTAGDFLETIDEYSQHFGAMGLSGKDMTDIIIAGFQSGQRDADKLADAVKEMRIRTVEDSEAISESYGDLQLDQERLQDAILEGGPAAREAFREIIGALQDVEDPVEQNRLAVELIGTQYEDLGPTALDALGAITDGTVEATGATDDLTESLEGAESEWERLKRRGEGYLGELGEGFAGFANGMLDFDLGDWGTFFGPNGELSDAPPQMDDLSDSASAMADILNDVVVAEEELAYWQGQVNRTSADQRVVAEELAYWQEQVAASTELYNTTVSRSSKLTQTREYWESQMGRAVSDTADEVDALKDAYDELRGTIDDRQSYLDLQNTLDDLGEKGREAYQAAAEGAEDADRKVREYELAQIALKNEIIDYAEQIGNVPEEKLTDVLALVDEGAVANVRQALDLLALPRNVVFNPVKSGNAISFGSGTSRVEFRRGGGIVEANQPYVVGEGGRELFVPDRDGRVVSAADVRRGGKAATTVVHNHYMTNYILEAQSARATGHEIERLQRMRL